MRKIFYTPNWPATTLDHVSARAYGAAEIVQSDTLAGYVDILEDGDTVDGRLAQLADRRWNASQVTQWRGYDMPCDSAAGTNVNGAILAAQLGGPASRTWKMGQGVSEVLTTADLVDLGLSMAAHVQACFDNEAALAAQIKAADDPASIDIETGWPS